MKIKLRDPIRQHLRNLSATRKALQRPLLRHDELKSELSLVDVVSEVLKQPHPEWDGEEARFHCFSHSPDSTPSLWVRDEHRSGFPRMGCNVCDFSDDIFGFLCRVRGFTPAKAVQWVTDRISRQRRGRPPTPASHATVKKRSAHPTQRRKALFRQTPIRYRYRTRKGTVLYEVRRYDLGTEKTFRLHQPDGSVGLGTRRVPYRLYSLAKTRPSHVYWVEGEKCVETLRTAGVRATTSVGGANGYHEKYRYPEQLKRVGVKSITVLPDNDGPGRLYADRVGRDFKAEGFRVTIVALPNLPEKGDVVDWLAAGHTVRQLRSMPPRLPTPIRLQRDAVAATAPITWNGGAR
jgi:hypothetical protein